MKKCLILIAMIFLACGFASAASTGLTVDISKYEPYPAEPGKYIDVWVKVANIGGDDADNVQIELSPVFPFSLDSNENATRYVGTVDGGKESILRFKVRVDQNAVQGENFLDIKYKYAGYDWLTKRMIIFVQTHDAILSLKRVYTQPDMMVPGEVSKVTFEIENLADSFLSDINIKLDLTNESLPFAPINSTTEQRVYVIDSGEIKNIEFSIAALPDADSGIYRIPVEISYSDGTGADYSRTDTIGLTVGDEPLIELYIDESEILSSGESGTIKFTIVNRGLTDLKLLNIKLSDSDYIEKLNTDVVYVGDLDSDDTDNVDFKVYVKPTSEKTVMMPFEINYLDKNNNAFTENINVPLKLYSGSEISKYNLRTGGNYTWLIVLIAFAVIGYVAYKYYWKRK